jgi:2-desacetyl-2-hydroxyethyl bacteriochlorophyllide A dehydrogenase
MRSARAFWVTSASTGAIREEELREPRPGEVLVEAVASGVSRGTESLVWSGRVPESEYGRMRCPHQTGDFPFPVKYGYSSVGRVAAGSSELAGKNVFCLYPHQTAYVVAKEAVVAVPEGVPPERAILAANLETAVNALWDAPPQVGDRLTVVGGGVVGCLVAYLAAKTAGADVELVDVNASRERIADVLGARFAPLDAASRDRDLVFHASGRQDGLRTALDLAGKEATVVELSWFGRGDVALPLGEAFHAQRLTLRASQVGSVSPRARTRFTHRKRLELALSLLTDPALDVLIDGESAFDDLPHSMADLTRAPGPLCHRVRY